MQNLRLIVFFGLLALHLPSTHGSKTVHSHPNRRLNDESEPEVLFESPKLGPDEERKSPWDHWLVKKIKNKVKKNLFLHSHFPSVTPTYSPSFTPTVPPTSESLQPSISPTTTPTYSPSVTPTEAPTSKSLQPSISPTATPTYSPSLTPTYSPSDTPTVPPTSKSLQPSISPTTTPTYSPSVTPTEAPTSKSLQPSISPTATPTYSPSSTPTYSPSLTPTYSPSVTPTKAPSIEGCLKFTWTLPADPSVITWNNPLTEYVKAFEKVQEAWDKIKAKVDAGIQNIKKAVDKLASLVPDDITWKSFSFLEAGKAIYDAYQAVVAAVDAVKDIPKDVIAVTKELLAAIQDAKLQDFLKIDVHPLTGKALLLDIKKVCDNGPDEIKISNEPQPLSSTKSFPFNPTKLGKYSPEFGTHSLPHTQTLTLNGNLGLQQYNVSYDGEIDFLSKQVDGWTEENTFLKIQQKWADMQGPLGTMTIITAVVSQAIVTAEKILDAIPNPGGVLDAIEAPLSFTRITLGNALTIIRSLAEGEFKAIVKGAGAMIEALPEKDPINANENTNSVANAGIFPQYVP